MFFSVQSHTGEFHHINIDLIAHLNSGTPDDAPKKKVVIHFSVGNKLDLIISKESLSQLRKAMEERK
jgi:hypothetical protein